MVRHCDGTDPNLQTDDREPCACGLVFDDVERVVIYPHNPVGGGSGLDRVAAAVRAARGGPPRRQIVGYA